MVDPLIVQAYSQSGGDLPYFVGGYQDGAGWLRTLGRFAFPILKRVFNVAQNTAEDVLVKEKPVLSSLGSNAMAEVGRFIRGKGSSSSSSTINRSKVKRNMTVPPLFSKKRKRKR